MNHETQLRRLDAKVFGAPSSNPARELAEFERELDGLRLPESYRSFLLRFCGPVSFENGSIYRPLERSPLVDDHGMQAVEILYGLGGGDFGIRYNYRVFSNQLPPHVFAIGDAPFGNQVCMAFVGPQRGQIYFWDHEEPNELRELYHVARSFDEFLEMLEPEPGINDPV